MMLSEAPKGFIFSIMSFIEKALQHIAAGAVVEFHF